MTEPISSPIPATTTNAVGQPTPLRQPPLLAPIVLPALQSLANSSPITPPALHSLSNASPIAPPALPSLANTLFPTSSPTPILRVLSGMQPLGHPIPVTSDGLQMGYTPEMQISGAIRDLHNPSRVITHGARFVEPPDGQDELGFSDVPYVSQPIHAAHTRDSPLSAVRPLPVFTRDPRAPIVSTSHFTPIPVLDLHLPDVHHQDLQMRQRALSAATSAFRYPEYTGRGGQQWPSWQSYLAGIFHTYQIGSADRVLFMALHIAYDLRRSLSLSAETQTFTHWTTVLTKHGKRPPSSTPTYHSR